jgi:hypothetical protein
MSLSCIGIVSGATPSPWVKATYHAALAHPMVRRDRTSSKVFLRRCGASVICNSAYSLAVTIASKIARFVAIASIALGPYLTVVGGPEFFKVDESSGC